jgi:hypothetical protein
MPSWCWQVNWGNCGIPWVNCAVLCVKDYWKGHFWGLHYCLSELHSLLIFFPSGMMSYSKIIDFNCECIWRYLDSNIVTNNHENVISNISSDYQIFKEELAMVFCVDETLKFRGEWFFQKYRSHLKTVSTRRVTWSEFHNEYPQMLDTTIQNLFAQYLCAPILLPRWRHMELPLLR